MLRVILAVALLGLTGCAGGSGMTSQPNKTVEGPAYIFAEIAVDDFDQYFAEYGAPLGEVLPLFEGTIVAATRNSEVREGEKQGNWTVLAKFPSMALARAFYDSEEYAPLRNKRINELTSGSRLILIPTTQPAG